MRDRSDRELESLFALDDAPGPARKVDGGREAAIIAGALGGAGFPGPGGPGGPGGGASGGGGGGAAAGAAKGLATAKLVVVAGGALAVAIAGGWLALRAPRAAAPPAPAVAVAPTPEAPLPPALPPASEPITAPIAETVADARVAVAPRPARASVAKPARAHRPPPGGEPSEIAAAPEDLLAAANAARAAHRWREADTLYGRVGSSAPGELAAQAALVASASLHLEHLGDPAGAVRRFRAALAAGSRDALAEDARWGLAEAARALDDAAAERRALDDFLAHHAGSVHAAQARARRAALEAPP